MRARDKSRESHPEFDGEKYMKEGTPIDSATMIEFFCAKVTPALFSARTEWGTESGAIFQENFKKPFLNFPKFSSGRRHSSVPLRVSILIS